MKIDCEWCFAEVDPFSPGDWQIFLAPLYKSCDCDNGWSVDCVALKGVCPDCHAKGRGMEDVWTQVSVSRVSSE